MEQVNSESDVQLPLPPDIHVTRRQSRDKTVPQTIPGFIRPPKAPPPVEHGPQLLQDQLNLDPDMENTTMNEEQRSIMRAFYEQSFTEVHKQLSEVAKQVGKQHSELKDGMQKQNENLQKQSEDIKDLQKSVKKVHVLRAVVP